MSPSPAQNPPASWSGEELDRIGGAEEVHIATRRRDGTSRAPLPVWVVRTGDDLYVRSVNGRTAAWFRGALARRAGRVRAGGVDRDVAFVEVGGGPDARLNDRVDAAYEAKYGRRDPTIVPRIVRPEARDATLRLVPR